MPAPNSPAARRRQARVVEHAPVGVQAVVVQQDGVAVHVAVPTPDYPRRLRTRYIREVGVIARLRIYWDAVKRGEDGRYAHQNTCPNMQGRSGGRYRGSHNAYGPWLAMNALGDWEFGKPEDYPAEQWPTHCSDCGEPVPTEHWGDSYVGRSDPAGTVGVYLVRQVFATRGYDTPSQRPEPGDIFWRTCIYRSSTGDACSNWDNCPGQHLIAVLPNGHQWDIDGRASNCGEAEDTPEKREAWKKERTHRCWVKHGDPAKGDLVTVNKSGATCPAGGGSIWVDNYHGHLRDGVFDP